MNEKIKKLINCEAIRCVSEIKLMKINLKSMLDKYDGRYDVKRCVEN